MVYAVSETTLDFLPATLPPRLERVSPLLLPLSSDLRWYQITLVFGHASLLATVKNEPCPGRN